MARPLSTAVAVRDLEYITEYLVRLAYAGLDRAINAERVSGNLLLERKTILEVALTLEELTLAWNYDRCSDVERCCATLETVIKKTLSPDGIRRMRTAVRRMRMQGSLPAKHIVDHYARWSSDDNQGELEV